MIRYTVLLFSFFFLTAGTVDEKKSKPVIYLIGDSTVKNGSGKGATPIVCSLIPRNIWENGKVARSSNDYAKWTEESAVTAKAFFINLNEIIALKYETLGEEAVKTKLFLTDHTHTTEAGAILNASVVAEGIKDLKRCKLRKYLKE
ncbi:MAG: hypothetical protein MUO72_16055 [Bacteroidales bacterium]|nr:hypothetical protein [Bacteroidales bacterium]